MSILCKLLFVLSALPVLCRSDSSGFERCSNGEAGCFGIPEGCGSDAARCNAHASFRPRDQTRLEVTLTGNITGSDYVALGISEDAAMGDDLVFSCVAKDGSEPEVLTSVNRGHDGSEVVPPSEADVVGAEALARVEGSVLCTFHVLSERITVKKGKKDDDALEINLSEKDYYVMVAYGRYSNSKLMKHRDKGVSGEPLRLHSDRYGGVEGRSILLIQLHGVLMVLAWGVLAWTGMEFPLAYKSTGGAPDRKLCGEKVWFAFHRSLMYLTVGFTIVGFILIMVYNKGWHYSTEQLAETWLHPVWGLCTLILAPLQPLIAYFRPHPEDEQRPVFNWTHRVIAASMSLFACSALITSVALEKASLPKQTLYFLVGFFVTNFFLLSFVAGYSMGEELYRRITRKTEEAKAEIRFSDKDVRATRVKLFASVIRLVVAVTMSGAIIYFIISRDKEIFK